MNSETDLTIKLNYVAELTNAKARSAAPLTLSFGTAFKVINIAQRCTPTCALANRFSGFKVGTMERKTATTKIPLPATEPIESGHQPDRP